MVAPRPCTTAIRPLSSGANQRWPSFQRGPPNSSSRGQSGTPRSTLGRPSTSFGTRSSAYRFHQPERSAAYSRRPSVDHSTCAIDSSGPPATVRAPWKVPSPPIPARTSSDPSHGMRGWSQASQAARRPSGEIRGPVRKRCRSSVSSRTPSRSCAAEPSSGTAASTRRTSTGPSPVNSSSTHHTSPRSTSTCGSAHLSPPPTGDTGVSGRGTPPGRYRYSRWSAKCTKTTSGSPSTTAPAQGCPPYSMTRLRTFHGAGSTDSSVPSAPRRTRVRRPPSVGRGSVHHGSSPTKPTYSGCPSCAAASAASRGEGQEPYANVRTSSPMFG